MGESFTEVVHHCRIHYKPSEVVLSWSRKVQLLPFANVSKLRKLASTAIKSFIRSKCSYGKEPPTELKDLA